MTPDFQKFFRAYADAFNRSLGDRVDADAITAVFADCFVDASPAGVQCGKNDNEFRASLDKGYEFYKNIGTQQMRVRGLDVTPIDALHHMVVVHWTATYLKDKKEIAIDFDVNYLLQSLDASKPKIFAFIAGDEMALLKERGIIDEIPGGDEAPAS